MAALDFPTSPANGDKYPVPAVAGLPIYTWDGEKWTTVGGSVISGTPSNALPLMDNTPAVAGAATNYTREDHVHPVDTKAVRSDVATGWTAAQQQLARQNAYAAPFDAMAYSGLQINGGMEISQEKGSSATVTNSQYICDGWKLYFGGSMAITASAGAAVAFASVGFPYNLGISVNTGQASLGPSDFALILQPIEGWRIARLNWGSANAQPLTIGFWSNHHRVGVYGGSLRNGANTRTYAFTYTQNAVDTAQYNVITIPGDTAGTWAIDNTTGIQLAFTLGSGSNFIAPSANAWQAGSYFAAPGQINGVAATSDIFRITGVIVLPGNEAPSAARSPFVMRSFADELIVCKRYWEVAIPYAVGYQAAGASNIAAAATLTVDKRAVPTLTLAGSSFVNATYASMSATQRAVRVAASVTATGLFVLDATVYADARL